MKPALTPKNRNQARDANTEAGKPSSYLGAAIPTEVRAIYEELALLFAADTVEERWCVEHLAWARWSSNSFDQSGPSFEACAREYLYWLKMLGSLLRRRARLEEKEAAKSKKCRNDPSSAQIQNRINKLQGPKSE